MDKSWRLTVHGVRGSGPRPSAEFMEYGGNTACMTLERDGRLIVFDAGTGLSAVGGDSAVKRYDILISHLHLDHVQGLLSFRPVFDPEAEIYLYGCAGLKSGIGKLISPPLWPLTLPELSARLHFRELSPGEGFELGGLSVSTMAGSHPGGSLIYRLDGDGKRLVYALDCETNRSVFKELAEFARGSDLIVWDANFAPGELIPSWGHSTWEQGLELGRAAGAKRVLMTHFSYNYTDEFLRGQERAAGDGACLFARERMEIEL